MRRILQASQAIRDVSLDPPVRPRRENAVLVGSAVCASAPAAEALPRHKGRPPDLLGIGGG